MRGDPPSWAADIAWFRRSGRGSCAHVHGLKRPDSRCADGAHTCRCPCGADAAAEADTSGETYARRAGIQRDDFLLVHSACACRSVRRRRRIAPARKPIAADMDCATAERSSFAARRVGAQCRTRICGTDVVRDRRAIRSGMPGAQTLAAGGVRLGSAARSWTKDTQQRRRVRCEGRHACGTRIRDGRNHDGGRSRRARRAGTIPAAPARSRSGRRCWPVLANYTRRSSPLST